MRLVIGCVFGIGIFGVTTPVLAQVAPGNTTPVESAAAGPAPAFMMMDVDGERSKLEVDTGISLPIDGGGDNLIWTPRLRLQGKIGPAYALYATLGAGAVTGNGGELELTNPELGGIYHARVSPTSAVSVHAGAVAGLHDSNDGSNVAAVTAGVRPSDAVMAGGGASWLRLGVSDAYRGEQVCLRLDLGLDQRVGGPSSGVGTLVHLNAGLGFGNARWTTALELQLLAGSYGAGVQHFQTVGVSVHYNAGAVTPYFGLIVPFGESYYDAFTLALGAAFAL